jgi:hypothetical protein
MFCQRATVATDVPPNLRTTMGAAADAERGGRCVGPVVGRFVGGGAGWEFDSLMAAGLTAVFVGAAELTSTSSRGGRLR